MGVVTKKTLPSLVGSLITLSALLYTDWSGYQPNMLHLIGGITSLSALLYTDCSGYQGNVAKFDRWHNLIVGIVVC